MVKLQRLIDKYVGMFIVFFFSALKFLDSKPKQHQKFLIIKLWAIGDSIITLSLIKALRTKIKGSHIDILTRNRVLPVYNSYDHDKIINLDKLQDIFFLLKHIRYYDIVFDCEPYLNLSALIAFFAGKERIGFKNQFRSRLYNKTVLFNKKQHMVKNYLQMLRCIGIKYETKKLEKLQINKKYQKRIDTFLMRHKVKKTDLLIGITPGVAQSAKSRMWFEDRFAQLADKLIEDKAKIVFIDSAENKRIVAKIMKMMNNKAIDASGIFNLYEVFYLISRCKIFISNDTGPMHIAAAQGCKTIGLFGPNTPTLWAPYGKDNISIRKTKLPPSIQNDKGIFPDKNREGFMAPINVEDVYNAVKKIISKFYSI